MRAPITGLLILLVCYGNAHSAPGPVDVAKLNICLTSNIPADVRAQSVEFLSTDRGGGSGSRTLTGRIFASQEVFAAQQVAGAPKQKQVRVVLQIDGPKDLAGAAYLVRESGIDSNDGTYVYLPSVGSVRKITGAAATASLLGTDFSYHEFKLLLNAYDDVTTTLESVSKLDGRPVFVATFKPNDSEADVGLTRGWIDQETCVPLKFDFYRDKALRKQAVIRRDAVKSSDNVWYPTEIDIKDLDKGSRTVLRANIVQRSGAVPSNVFDVDQFYKRVKD